MPARFVWFNLKLARTHTQKITNQGVDECIFFTELCLKKRVLLAELLHLFSELGKLLRLQPVHLRAVSLAVRLTLALLTWIRYPQCLLGIVSKTFIVPNIRQN